MFYSCQFCHEPTLPTECSLLNYFWKNVHVDCLAVILYHLNGGVMSGFKHCPNLPERAREMANKKVPVCACSHFHTLFTPLVCRSRWFTASEWIITFFKNIFLTVGMTEPYSTGLIPLNTGWNPLFKITTYEMCSRDWENIECLLVLGFHYLHSDKNFKTGFFFFLNTGKNNYNNFRGRVCI